MGWRFQKSVTLLLGRGLTFGRRGFRRVSVGRHGTRPTASLPGSGLAYSWWSPWGSRGDRQGSWGRVVGLVGIVLASALVIWHLWG